MSRNAPLHDDYLRTPVEYELPPRQDNLFLWTVFLLLLVGFSMVCWIGSYLIFNRPEIPLSYKILRKIKKIDLPTRFKVTDPPKGEFLNAEKIYNRYQALSRPALRDLNLVLERNYLRNYPINNELVPYVTGRFTILDSYELAPSDFVTSGVVALAVSADYPRLLIEHVYSAGPTVAPTIKRNLRTGMDIDLRRTYELTAVLHATRLDDGHLLLTVVPLNYGSYIFNSTDGGFSLEPPLELNVGAGWPVIRDERYEQADRDYVAFRTKEGLGPLVARRGKDSDKPADTAIKGVDVPEPVETPAGSPSAQLARAGVGKPAPGGPANSVGRKPAAPVASPAASIAVARAEPVTHPVAVNESPRSSVPPPPPVLRPAAATPLPVLKAATQGGVSLQPFLIAPKAGETPAAPDAAGSPPSDRSWPTYAAGRQPSGRRVDVAEVAALNQRGGLESLNGETVYLSGQFTVRALGENKSRGIKNAVLRSGSDANVRVIVEYPSDLPLPAQGSEITRDEQRPYQITAMRVTNDGTLNVYAREIIN